VELFKDHWLGKVNHNEYHLITRVFGIVNTSVVVSVKVVVCTVYKRHENRVNFVIRAEDDRLRIDRGAVPRDCGVGHVVSVVVCPNLTQSDAVLPPCNFNVLEGGQSGI
jgi:hypothetical protein